MTMRMTSTALLTPYSVSATSAIGKVDSTTPKTGMKEVIITRMLIAP